MPKPPASERVVRGYKRVRKLFIAEIWEFPRLHDRSLKGRAMALLRVLAITFNGLFDNRLFTRAAALSYSSLLGLGPLVALLVMLSGTFIQGDPKENIKEIIAFIAPTTQQYVELENGTEDTDTPTSDPTTTDAPADDEMANALDALLDQIIAGAGEKLSDVDTSINPFAGILSVGVIFFVGINLLVTIETALNFIWGVRQGRTWFNRVSSYISIIVLGAIFGLGSFGLLSASTVANTFQILPIGANFLYKVFLFAAPLISFLMASFLLTFFYMYFPNTRVRFLAAFSGAAATVLLLFLNNYLSVLYIGSVLNFKSFFGSLGIIPVLMLGLYFFWVFVLLGGQITYAVQNVNYLVNQQAWSNISQRARESLALCAFLVICRRFINLQEPLTASELGERIRVPGNVLNSALSSLITLGLIAPTRQDDDDEGLQTTYQPAKPLGRITLADFKHLYETKGNSEGFEMLQQVDPLMPRYQSALNPHDNPHLTAHTLDHLLDQTQTQCTSNNAQCSNHNAQ